MRRTTQAVLIIADDQALADSLLRIVRTHRPDDLLSTMTYGKLSAELSARLRDRDVFILGLLRQYPGGLRAEGIALSELLLSRGKKVLVISPLHIEQLADNPMYWDTASKAPLVSRISHMMDRPLRRDLLAELKHVFSRMLAIPPQH